MQHFTRAAFRNAVQLNMHNKRYGDILVGLQRLKTIFTKRNWILLLLIISAGASIIYAVLVNQQAPILPDPTPQIESAVRASFPNFCQNKRMLIQLTASGAATYWIGCESTDPEAVPAFRLNVATCAVDVFSVSYESELGDLDTMPETMKVCPTK
jgi:hypothetical protein